jgi:cytochrome P450
MLLDGSVPRCWNILALAARQPLKKLEVSDTVTALNIISLSDCLLPLLVRAVLMECMRIFHPVPSNARESRPRSTVLPPSDPTFPFPLDTPMYVPPSTSVAMFPFLLHRNPVLWGDDAEVFDPERWIEPQRLKRFTDNPAMFMPFSGGPRIVSLSHFLPFTFGRIRMTEFSLICSV